MSSNIIRYHQISSDIIKYHQISSDIIKYHQISSNIIKYHTGLQVATITENKILMITSLPQDPHLHGIGILIMLLKHRVVGHRELLIRDRVRPGRWCWWWWCWLIFDIWRWRKGRWRGKWVWHWPRSLGSGRWWRRSTIGWCPGHRHHHIVIIVIIIIILIVITTIIVIITIITSTL